MPSPRLSGSGVWKILPLSHGLKNQVLHLIALFPYSLQPIIGMFLRRGPFGVRIRAPCFASFPWGRVLSFLETVTSKVSELLTVVTLYSPHIPSFGLLSNIPFPRCEGWHGRLTFVVGFRTVVVMCFGSVGSSSIRRGVHGVWVASSVQGGPGVVEL